MFPKHKEKMFCDQHASENTEYGDSFKHIIEVHLNHNAIKFGNKLDWVFCCFKQNYLTKWGIDNGFPK